MQQAWTHKQLLSLALCPKQKIAYSLLRLSEPQEVYRTSVSPSFQLSETRQGLGGGLRSVLFSNEHRKLSGNKTPHSERTVVVLIALTQPPFSNVQKGANDPKERLDVRSLARRARRT